MVASGTSGHTRDTESSGRQHRTSGFLPKIIVALRWSIWHLIQAGCRLTFYFYEKYPRYRGVKSCLYFWTNQYQLWLGTVLYHSVSKEERERERERDLGSKSVCTKKEERLSGLVYSTCN